MLGLKEGGTVQRNLDPRMGPGLRRDERIKGMALAVCAAFAAALPARADPPSTVMFDAMERVCGPATQQQKPPDAFAERAGYTPEATRPPGIPTVAPGLRVWRAPSDTGRVYVFAGVFPPPAEPSTCVVAVYDADAPFLEEDVAKRITEPKIGFAPNPRLSLETGDYRLRRFDRKVGDRIDTVQFMTPTPPRPDGPRQIVSVYSVGYGWMLKLPRK